MIELFAGKRQGSWDGDRWEKNKSGFLHHNPSTHSYTWNISRQTYHVCDIMSVNH